MNASESTVESKSSGEELSRFFAETSAANAKHKKAAAAPAKGSILNFFKPPAQTKEPKASSSSALLEPLLCRLGRTIITSMPRA